MKIVIFGGTFDPIHNGHETILKAAMQHSGASKCILVPNAQTKYKQTSTSPIHRLNMLQIVANKNHWEVDKYEINQPNKISYSIDLVKYLKQKYPSDELLFLIGSDQLDQFNQWYQYQEILKYVTLLVYPRGRINKSLLAKYNAFCIEGNYIDINSTNIRKNYLMDYVDKDVAQYIIWNGLYVEGLLRTYMDEKRYLHSMRVAQTAKTIANKLRPELEHDAWLAGLYHDLAKCFSQDKLEMIAYEVMGINHDSWKVLHGPVGAYYLNRVYHFNDHAILNAITRHTKPFNFGSPITFLDKVLYCADKLEPNRTDEDINNIAYFRELFHKDVDQCFEELYSATQKQYH